MASASCKIRSGREKRRNAGAFGIVYAPDQRMRTGGYRATPLTIPRAARRVSCVEGRPQEHRHRTFILKRHQYRRYVWTPKLGFVLKKESDSAIPGGARLRGRGVGNGRFVSDRTHR